MCHNVVITVIAWCCGLLECANYGPPPPTSALRVTWWRFSRNASFTLLDIYVFIVIWGAGPPREFVDPRAKWNLAPSSNSPNNDTQTKSTMVCHKQGISTTKMNCDLENSFLLVYLSGSWLTPHPLSVGLRGPIDVSLFNEILINSMKMNIFCIKILKVFCNCVWPFKYIVISL